MYELFWTRVTDILRNSVAGRIYLALVSWISGTFKSSWLYSFFVSKSMSDYAKGSKISTLFRRLVFKSGFSEMVSQSYIVRLVAGLPELFLSSPCYVLSFYLIPSSIILFIRYFGEMPFMALYIVSFVVGIALLGLKKTIGKVLGDSFIFKRVCSYFYVDTEYENSPKPIYVCALAAAFSLLPLGASFVVSIRLTTVMFAALVALPILFASPLMLLVLTMLMGMVLSTLPAAFLAAVTSAVVLFRLFTGKEKLPQSRVASVLVALYMFLTLFYTFNGFGGGDGMLAGSIQFIFLLLFFSVVIVINSREKFKRIINAISVCTLYTGFYGVYQRITGQGGTGWSNDENYVGGLRRISATFMNPNVYGIFLIFAVCVIIVAILLSEKLKWKIFYSLCLCLQLVNLALTYSRGCYIAVAIAVFVMVWCCDKRLLGFGIFAIPIIPYVLPQNILIRILSVGSYLKDSSVTYRFSIWRASLKVIKNHWFIGSGVGTVAFISFYQKYMLAGVTAQHSHNFFLQITIELSIVATALMLLIILYSVKDACNVVKNANLNKNKFMIIPLVASFVGVMFEGMVDYLFYNNVIYLTFWVVLALFVAGLNIISSENGLVEEFQEV